MTTPINYESSANPRQPWRIPKAVVVMMVLIGLGVLLFRPLVGLFFGFILHSSKSVPPAEVTESVGFSLVRWGVFGAVPQRDSAYMNLQRSIVGINGFTESGGMDSAGTDWYEIELSPDFAGQLRSIVTQSSAVEQSSSLPRYSSAPSWWPKTWPADAHCYEVHNNYRECLVLSDTGTRAWFVRLRW